MRRVLIFVRSRLYEARKAKASQYNNGYVDALEEVDEFITDALWEQGEEA